MNSFTSILFVLLSLSKAFAGSQSAGEMALAIPARTSEEKKIDEFRHPKELLDFSKIKAGDTVVDFFPGKGYFTRLLSSVVGERGHVIAHVPKEVEGASFKPVESIIKNVEKLKNVEVKVVPLTIAPAENVDVIWTTQIYHDLHIKKFIDADVAAFNKMLFKMLKPGGHLIVVDHVANDGTTEADIEKLHRINPKMAKLEIEAAGFVLEDESKTLLRNEDHKLNVFDPAIRGKTDQFAFRFVKPKK
jgi:predicted methyltransferase